MGSVIAFSHVPESDHYERVAKRYNEGLEEEKRLSAQIDAIRQRFLEGEFLVQSGPRRGKPLTRKGRALLWERLQSLMRNQAWLFTEQRRLYELATGWRSQSEGAA